MSRRILLATAAALLIASAAFAQIVSEISITRPQYGPAPGDQSSPVVATNGSDFFVAWFDNRANVPSVYADVVASDGTPRPGTGTRIAVDPRNAVARLLGAFRLGGAYVVVFTVQRVLPDFSSRFENYVARFDDGGTLMETRRVGIDDFFPVAAAASNSRILLAGISKIAVLDDRGTVLQQGPFSAAGVFTLGAASNGSTFLVASYSNPPVSIVAFTAIDAEGRTIGASSVSAAGSGEAPVVGSDGNRYLAVFRDAPGLATRTQVVQANGDLGKSGTLPPLAISTARGALAWTGRKYVLAATTADDQHATMAATLSADGSLVDAPRSTGMAGTAGMGNGVAVAWGGTRALVAGSAGSPDTTLDVQGVIVGEEATLLSPPRTIPRSAAVQSGPRIAGGPANDLAVWVETDGVHAARLTRAGAVLDPDGIPVAAFPISSRLLALAITPPLAVVFDGSAYLVAWREGTDLRGRRVDPESGALLGDAVTYMSGCVNAFDLGRDDAGIVAFASTCNGLFAQRLGAGGAAGSALRLSPEGMSTGVVDAAWNGSEWLVAFNEVIALPLLISPPLYRGNVYAVRLTSGLTLLDTLPIPLAVTENENGWNPVAATDGRDFLVAWTHVDEGSVRARAVRADGSAGETMTVAAQHALARDLAWDGARYALAFALPSSGGVAYELWLTHVGAAPAGDRVAISVAPSDQRNVALRARAGAPLRAVYDCVRLEPEYGGVYSVVARDLPGSRRRVVAAQ